MNRINPPTLSRNVRDSAPSRHSNPTSLPSIHQLHPYLPQSPQSASTYLTTSPYTYPHGGLPHIYNTSSASTSQQTIEEQRSYDQQYGARRSSMRSVHTMEEEGIGADSDLEGEGIGEQRDLQEPPKKKRRRQALSCTECKRRKIKCDRNQPCGPCMKRGEPDRCQWHIVEPTDKYVSRTEWEDLHSRYTRLEARYEKLESVFLELHPELSHRLSPMLSPSGSRHSRVSSHSTTREIPPTGGTTFTGTQRTPPQGHHLSFGSSSTSASAPSQSSTYSEDNRNSPSILLRRPSLIILEPEVVTTGTATPEDNKSRSSPVFSGDINPKSSLTEPINTLSSRASPLSLTSIISGPVQSTASATRVFSPTIAEQRERRQRSP